MFHEGKCQMFASSARFYSKIRGKGRKYFLVSSGLLAWVAGVVFLVAGEEFLKEKTPAKHKPTPAAEK
jgi:hypothetical protein